jgi:hypothetical protein
MGANTLYIVMLKLEAAAAAQSIGNGQLMVLKVGIFEQASFISNKRALR